MGFRPSEPPVAEDAAAWVTGAVPDGWFSERPDVIVDRDEIIIWGRLPEPELGADATEAAGPRRRRAGSTSSGRTPGRIGSGWPGRSNTVTSARSPGVCAAVTRPSSSRTWPHR